MKLYTASFFRISATVFFLFIAVCGTGQVRLPRLISDGMVLQRNTRVTLWGWAAAGEKVTVAFLSKSYAATADASGKWSVTLPPVKEGGPYSMEITASNHLTLNDIYFGDVWICSGQSNMVLSMERVKEKYPDAIAHADYPLIRQFVVPLRYDFNADQEDIASGSWEKADPKTVLRFSAAAFFFARTLFEKYHVPIGLVVSAVGGSPAEAWLSADALKKFPDLMEIADKFKSSYRIDSIRKAETAMNDMWYSKLNKADEGLKSKPRWSQPENDASSWAVMKVPGYWKDGPLGKVNGSVWFRKDFDLPSGAAGKPAKLFLGRIVDRDSVFINGTFVGAITYQYPPRRYEVAPGILKGGKNTITVRVINSSGAGGFVTDKPYQLVIGDQTVDLKGDWRYKLGAQADSLPPQTFFQYKPGGLYKGMIAPLTPYAMKGVIWYQGEANVSTASEYQRMFSTLIADWRAHWKLGNFPFLYVQLANFLEKKDEPAESDWALLRDAQLKTLSVPNTGMAVAIDLGEWNDIHPLNKEDVGKRLALAAERIAYGDTRVVSSGPLYQSMTVAGNKAMISFTSQGGGLVARGGKALKGFSVAGADGKFVWAKAAIEGNKVAVWSDSVSKPVAVRYAWADNPEGANLYNKEGLPASPFRTDH